MNNRVTRGANFNLTNPDDVELLAWLDQFGNASDTMKRALREYRDKGSQPPPITEQELAELRAENAWLRQNQSAPGVTPTNDDAPAAAAAVVQPGAPVSETFKNGVRKMARPGLRLE